MTMRLPRHPRPACCWRLHFAQNRVLKGGHRWIGVLDSHNRTNTKGKDWLIPDMDKAHLREECCCLPTCAVRRDPCACVLEQSSRCRVAYVDRIRGPIPGNVW